MRSLLCGPSSARLPGDIPGGGGFCPRGEKHYTDSTSSLTLAVCPRRASCATVGSTPQL